MHYWLSSSPKGAGKYAIHVIKIKHFGNIWKKLVFEEISRQEAEGLGWHDRLAAQLFAQEAFGLEWYCKLAAKLLATDN